jgi:hypothetical protein
VIRAAARREARAKAKDAILVSFEKIVAWYFGTFATKSATSGRELRSKAALILRTPRRLRCHRDDACARSGVKVWFRFATNPLDSIAPSSRTTDPALYLPGGPSRPPNDLAGKEGLI